MTSSVPNLHNTKILNISETRWDMRKRKTPFFFTFKGLSNSPIFQYLNFSFHRHFKMHTCMKQNQFFNSLKVPHFKDTVLKFELCMKKIGNFITPENCAILLSKMVFNRVTKMSWWHSVVNKTTRLQDDTACIGYTQHRHSHCHLMIQRNHSIQNRWTCCFASKTLLCD